jgi:hypothetical protein
LTGPKIALVIFLLVFGGLIYYFSTAPVRKLRSIVELLDKNSVKVQPSLRFSGVEGSFHGRQAQIFTVRGANELIFKLSSSTPLRFGAAKLPKMGPLTQNWRAVYAKMPVGDQELDAEYGFTSPEPARFKTWVLRPENKQAIKSVTPTTKNWEFCRVEAGNGWVLWAGPLSVWQVKPETVKPVLERLEAFARTVERAS